MRATEIIRGVLDLIDQIECPQEQLPADPIGGAFAQIFAQMTTEPNHVEQPNVSIYDNSPNVHVKDIASVTTAAGTGIGGVTSPADIKSNSISMYPAYQAEKK